MSDRAYESQVPAEVEIRDWAAGHPGSAVTVRSEITGHVVLEMMQNWWDKDSGRSTAGVLGNIRLSLDDAKELQRALSTCVREAEDLERSIRLRCAAGGMLEIEDDPDVFWHETLGELGVRAETRGKKGVENGVDVVTLHKGRYGVRLYPLEGMAGWESGYGIWVSRVADGDGGQLLLSAKCEPSGDHHITYVSDTPWLPGALAAMRDDD
jgi:hypothetical protein